MAGSIVDLVNLECSTITILEMRAEPGFDDWLYDVTPPFYFNVRLTPPASRTFDVQICMPLGTPPGIYDFKIYASGDGAVWTEMDVTVENCIPAVPVCEHWWWFMILFPLLIIIWLLPYCPVPVNRPH